MSNNAQLTSHLYKSEPYAVAKKILNAAVMYEQQTWTRKAKEHHTTLVT